MAISIKFSDPFESRVKRFVKKFPSLAGELIDFVETLNDNPLQGESLGAGLYKVRLLQKVRGKVKVEVSELSITSFLKITKILILHF